MSAMRTRTAAILAASISLSAIPLRAQDQPAAPEFLKNPGFEFFFERENLWNGVNHDGVLAGGTQLHKRAFSVDEYPGPPILTAEGGIGHRPMPISVSIADLNGDNLLDITAMENPGYLRVYFNSGTPQQPKFEKGELAPFFISRILNSDPTLSWIPESNKYGDFWYVRQTNRIHATDLLRSGKKDLLMGNYAGEVFLIPNTGSAQRPEFRTPADIAKVMLHTSKDVARKWGNLFAPATIDWNADGKNDLLLGEGSYSANSIHLLLNQGTAAAPKFDESAKHVLAYGMGLEQLTPCIVDYNGDSKSDLLVTESGGKVAIYLNSGQPWKPGDTLPMGSFLKVGGNDLSLGGISTISAGDLTGDGLFDLVFGKNDGLLAMAVNSGTKEAPKFDAVQDLKASSGVPKSKIPYDWELDSGYERGNFYATISVVGPQEESGVVPPEGSNCLKISYSPSPNTVMAAPTADAYMGPDKNFNHEKDITTYYENPMGDFELHKISGFLSKAASNFVALKNGGASPFQVGKTYTLSMKVKGANVSFASVYLGATASVNAAPSGQADSRGAVMRRTGQNRNSVSQQKKFSVGDSWTDVSLDLPVRFEDKRVGQNANINWAVYIVAELTPGTGVLYIDDVRVGEKK
jgi:hypothetical protein